MYALQKSVLLLLIHVQLDGKKSRNEKIHRSAHKCTQKKREKNSDLEFEYGNTQVARGREDERKSYEEKEKGGEVKERAR